MPRTSAELLQDYVRRIIAEKDLSHVKVAKRAQHLGVDLSPGSVNSIMQGYVKNPGLDTVYALSLGLGEPLEDLIAIWLKQNIPTDSAFKKSNFYLLWLECERLPEAEKREVKVLLNALKTDIQRRTLKS